MLFGKQSTDFNELKRDVFKKLSEIESEMKDSTQRKKITALIDKVYQLRPTTNQKALKIFEQLIFYVKELKKEMLSPIELIINNYIEKIDSLINEVKYESEG